MTRLVGLQVIVTNLFLSQGAFGFLMSIASLLSIKVTSPITHMVSSAVRGVAASFLGMWLFKDIITTCVDVYLAMHIFLTLAHCSGRASSIAVILFGSIYYTWVKHVESLPVSKNGSYERVPLEDVEAGKAQSKPE